MHDPGKSVATLRRKIEAGERGSSARDRDILLEFSDELSLLAETYGDHRHVKLLRHCCRMAELVDGVDLVDTLTDRDATETVVRWIHGEYDLDESPETNQNYRVALRVFGRRVTTEGVDGPDSPPPSIDWVNSTLPNSYDPSPNKRDMLTWEADVEVMLDACRNSRDAAAIALQFDAGLRGGELYDLRRSDLADTEHGLSVSADGKTGERAVDLIPSTPHVNRWLTDHPGGPDDYLWTRLTTPSQLSYQSYLNMFKRPADRADLSKPVTPTNFRKSNLAWLAKQGMNARYIERRQGRVAGSDAVARYVALFDEDIGDEYARLMGLEVADDDDSVDLAPLKCPRCDKETPRDEDRCVWCGHAVSNDAAEVDTEQNLDFYSQLAEAEGATADDILDLARFAEENAWFRSMMESRH